MYVIINGVNSDTIRGLQILSLPPITKPKMRTSVATIDGRPGDIVTYLGYEAYNKTIKILLHDTYDLPAIMAYFNQSGTIIFSNDPDKVYTFETIEQINYERAVKFKTASVTIHVQPYKLSASEQSETGEVETLVDRTPYIIRRTPFGTRQKGTIVGGSIVWNQLVKNGNFADTSNWTASGVTLSASNNILSVATTESGDRRAQQSLELTAGHKYLYMLDALSATANTNIFYLYFGTGSAWVRANATGTSWETYSGIIQAVSGTVNQLRLSNPNANTTNQFRNVKIHDLTLMFGPTIADYLYDQEQATAGAGVAWLKAHFPRIFDSGYIPYNAGTLEHVSGLSAHKMVGFNQWDEEWEVGGLSTSDGSKIASNTCIRSKNFIPCLQTTYFLQSTNAASYVWFYDSDYSFISFSTNTHNREFTPPTNASYMKLRLGDSSNIIQVYDNGTCINLSDPQRNGQYQPYQTWSYPLDSSLTLRGLLKLDGDNLYYDGDIYPPSGEVERRYAVRAYQSGDESDANVLTDGTNTVYKLATPTTEQAEPYTALQICDPAGTEEWVGANMPVGHETTYIDPISMTVTNEGNTTSAPSITIEGEGAVEVTVDGLIAFEINMPATGAITIDSKAMDATDGDGNLANRSVSGDYTNLQLAPGEHTIVVVGDVSNVTMKNVSRWL